jgi:hypothetical protein
VAGGIGYDPTRSPTPFLWASTESTRTESTRTESTSGSSSARASVTICFLIGGQP